MKKPNFDTSNLKRLIEEQPLIALGVIKVTPLRSREADERQHAAQELQDLEPRGQASEKSSKK